MQLGKLGFIMSMIAAPQVEARVLSAQSPVNQVMLVELYSSEGCSSCPPADKWLGELKSSPKLFKEFVPVAFHVDYWDYIGWKDRFAKSEYTERQKVLASGETMYTPEFFLNGQEWRHRSMDQLKIGPKKVGVLKVEINGSQIDLKFTPEEKFNAVEFHAALLLMDQVTEVKNGENGGASLHHEFVVDQHKVAKGLHQFKDHTAHLKFDDSKATRRAYAFWVTSPGEAKAIQAAGIQAD